MNGIWLNRKMIFQAGAQARICRFFTWTGAKNCGKMTESTYKGTAMNNNEPTGFITVFGGANMDIGGTPAGPLTPQDSNPGTIRTSMGGVGRNIAHNLALLGSPVKLVSAFGEDAHGRQLMDGCARAGIDIGESLVTGDSQTSTYLYITRADGEMELAINDMRIYSRMTPEFVAKKKHLLEESRLVIVDANLPEATIGAICRLSACPVFAEPVSCAKAKRLSKVLNHLHALTPNLQEAEALTGRDIDPDRPDSLRAAADALLAAGVRQVIITLGARGCFFTDRRIARTLPALPVHMVNGNGAGDALLAGFAAGFCRGLGMEESVRLGMAAASITLETALTNNPELSYERMYKRAMT